MSEYSAIVEVDGGPAVAVTVTPLSDRYDELAAEIWGAVEDVISDG